MIRFAPIAVVGRGCVLPGALDPDTFVQRLLAGDDLVSSAPEGVWRVPREAVLTEDPGASADRCWSDRGGYVQGFEAAFDPEGLGVSAASLAGLDPLFRWLIHAGRAALAEAGVSTASTRVGAVVGNLSFPSAGMSRHAEEVWSGEAPTTDARNRFMSGLPAQVLAEALGLSAPAMALDAACASSLYALKLAADALADGRADVMLAGAVNKADDLFIHVGFSALQALSKTGQSRPFHPDADGLVPAEGCVLFALKRLEDARRDGDRILGVLRGVGLSNDGRAGGILAPDVGGQARSLEAAYAEAGISPRDVPYVECHATGTTVGDAVELGTLRRVFGTRGELLIGSVKSNLGHPITAAGAVSLLKVLGALEHGVLPPTLHLDDGDLGDGLRVVTSPTPWPDKRPRRAAVSAFGFGGNNAHVLVEAESETGAVVVKNTERARVAVVGMAVRASGAQDAHAFAGAVLGGQRLAGADGGVASDLELSLGGLRFPPKDLQAALPQQLWVLAAAREALADLRDLSRERTGVFVGMGADPEVCRYGARWRLAGRAQAEGWSADALAEARDGVVSVLKAPGVVGTMPNIPANRIQTALDLAGPGFTVSSEERSGLDALAVARRAVETGELDVAVVGAVDMSCEPVHRAALAALGRDEVPGDAAVVLVLERLEAALSRRHRVLAVLDDDAGAAVRFGEGGLVACDLVGHAHAATGLVELAAAVSAVHHGARPGRGGQPVPWNDGQPRVASASASAWGAHPRAVTVRSEGPPAPLLQRPAPVIARFAGRDVDAVRARLERAAPGGDGAVRLVVVASDPATLATRARAASAALAAGHDPSAPGVAFVGAPVGGAIAWVIPGPDAARAHAGRGALLAWPELALAPRALDGAEPITTSQRALSVHQLVRLHTAMLADRLGRRAEVVLPLSAGRLTAMIALGAWRDDGAWVDALRDGVLDAPGQAAARVQGLKERPDTLRVARTGEAAGDLLVGPAQVLDAATAGLATTPVPGLGILHTDQVAGSLARWLAAPAATVSGARIIRPDGVAWRPSRADASSVLAEDLAAADDLAAMVVGAHEAGARTFVVLGPDAQLGERLSTLLGGRAHAVVRMDRRGEDPVETAVLAAAHLEALGHPVAPERLLEHLPRPAATSGPSLTLPAHWPAVRLPAASSRREDPVHIMPAAPWLPPITADADAPSERPRPARALTPPPPAPEPVVDGASLLGGGQAPRLTRLPEGVDLPPPPPPSTLGAASPPPTRRLRPPGPPRPTPAPSAPMPTPPTPAVTPAAHADRDHLTALLEHQATLAAQHRAFLAQQAEVHERFLGLRARTAAWLASGPTPVPTDAPSPAPAPAPAPAMAPPSAPRPAAPAPRPAPVMAKPVVQAPPVAPAPAAKAPAPVAPTPAAPAKPAVAASGASAPVVAPKPPVPAAQLPGPKLDRAQLEVHSSGRISEIFGPLFEQQDGFEVQVRMPEPPLLLADRMVGLDCEPGVLGKGTIWTETDVGSQSWYLNGGRMPAGVMIEAGQADLMLISYMGIDFLNQGDRAYRLLGCTLTYHGHLPRQGDTIRYEIDVDGHATQGDVRLFFFHYDCHDQTGRPVLSVRGGQAGFFTEAELDDSAGVLWDPASGEHDASAPVDPPDVVCTRRSFGPEAVEAFASGDAYACFGPGWEFAQTHNDPPKIQPPPHLFFHEITDLDPHGGPWKKGYLRATWKVSPDDWFFEGHFKNDPCMPGTLMFEGCLQAMAFYLAGLGYTIKRDGWRFEPVPGQPIPMRCRGQVLPDAVELVYEVFVEEVSSGPIPTVQADLLCTVDGLKAFHARRCGLQLVPAWPLDHLANELVPASDATTPCAEVDGFRFDQRSMFACAWGKPSEAFGPMYARYDGPTTVPRLPGPPYLFITRTDRVDGPLGGMKVGTTVRTSYEIPDDVWYFDENGAETMPFCVLVEAALQPCGWLASYVGSALTVDEEVFFRNLDGTGTLKGELTRGSGTLVTDVTLTNISNAGGMIIESFEVSCTIDDVEVYAMKTVFGFFPGKALSNQKGLPFTPEQRASLEAPSDWSIDLTERPAQFFEGTLRLPTPMLNMLDRIRGYWPTGGKAGLGRMVSEKDVDPSEWFFKAHFFQDPVQPGSLGLEAMLQLLQAWMIVNDLGAELAHPRFEPIALDEPMSWKYRGQVVPRNTIIRCELDVTGHGTDERGVWAKADARLWVDEICIYAATNVGMRIVDGGPPHARGERRQGEQLIDPAAQPWVGDHRPTWTLPALPFTDLMDRMASAAFSAFPGETVSGLADVTVKRWAVVDGTLRLRPVVGARTGDRVAVSLYEVRDGSEILVIEGAVLLGQPAPAPQALPALAQGEVQPAPYDTGHLFHGPALQVLTELTLAEGAASGWLDVGRDGWPAGLLHPGILDGSTHVVPHDRMEVWSDAVPADHAAYPLKVPRLTVHAPLPDTGSVRVEARLQGVTAGRFVTTDLQLISPSGEVLVSWTLTEVLMPKGPIGSADPAARHAFLADRRFVPGLALSTVGDDRTTLSKAVVEGSDWLPGTVRELYGLTREDRVAEVAVKDHLAQRWSVHPSQVRWRGSEASSPLHPLGRAEPRVRRLDADREVSGEPRLDVRPVARWWADWFGLSRWPVEDVYFALIERFVRQVHLTDAHALASLQGRPAIFLANHQVAIESLLFSIVASGLTHRPVVTIAKKEHRDTWLGRLIAHSFAWPGARDPGVITFFDRDNQAEMAEILAGLGRDLAAGDRSLMVHVQGTRSTTCREPVSQLSGAFLDLAIRVGVPVVPVRFVGGLPVTPAQARLDYPVGMGRQDLWIGAPIEAAALKALPLKERKQAVIDAINGLGVDPAAEAPLSGDPSLQAAVEARAKASGADPAFATILEVLLQTSRRSPATARLLEAVRTGTLPQGDAAEDAWLRTLWSWMGGPSA